MDIEIRKTELMEQIKWIQSEDILLKLQALLNKELTPKSTFEGLPDFEDVEVVTLADFGNRKRS